MGKRTNLKASAIISVFLVLGLVNGVLALTEWTGAGDGASWNDPANWSAGVPERWTEVDILPPPEQGPLIDVDVECGRIRGPVWTEDSNMVMEIADGTVVVNGLWRFAESGSGIPTLTISGGDTTVNGDFRWADKPGSWGVVNITGGRLTVTVDIKIGDEGGGELNVGGFPRITVNGSMNLAGAGPNAYVTVNMDGGWITVAGNLAIPSTVDGANKITLNLNAGTLDCNSYSHGDEAKVPFSLDIEQGVFRIAGDKTAQVAADVSARYITAYDGNAVVGYYYDAGLNKTIVAAGDPRVKASNPYPDDYSENVCPDMTLSWTPGEFVADHNIYFGTSLSDVNESATPLVTHWGGNNWTASALELDTTYYWRIDGVNNANVDSPWVGLLWHFTTNDGNAYDPYPADKQRVVPIDTVMTWSPGCFASSHDVYFGSDFDDVNGADSSLPVGTSVYKGRQAFDVNQYDPSQCHLDYLTWYYWRVDEVNGPQTRRGQVWSFRSISALCCTELVLWYKFDEQAPNNVAYDSSGYERHGPIDGPNDGWDPYDCMWGGCRVFDDDTAVIVPQNTLNTVSSGITICAWVKGKVEQTADKDMPIFDAGDGEGGEFKLTALMPSGAGEVVWRAGNDSNDMLIWDFDAAPSFLEGEWHWFVFIKDEVADEMDIYLDCWLAASKTDTTDSLANLASKPFKIGAYNYQANDYEGKLDEFRVYDRALSYCEFCWCHYYPCPWAPIPYHGQKDVPRDVVLTWRRGDDAFWHDVYFGTDFNDVNDANSSLPVGASVYKGRQSLDATMYDPCGLLELTATYYWRIDEFNDTNVLTCKGRIWRFTVAEFIIIDDMESYCGYGCYNWISDTWLDGFENWSGAEVYVGIKPTNPAHGGEKSMIYQYYNDGGIWGDLDYYSEVEREFSDPCDWTDAAVKILTLFFYGDPDNDANDTEQMYVGLEDSRGAENYAQVEYGYYGEDMDDIKIPEWREWNVALSDFSGVDANNIKKMYIGFGIRGNPNPDGIPGGDGIVHFDDIRLYLPKCLPERAKPIGDLTDDCVVDYKDLKIIADNWLVGPIEPNEPNACVGWWKLDEGQGNIAYDSSLYANHGTIVGGYSWVPGCDGWHWALEFTDGWVLVPDAPQLRPPTQVSVCAWINYSVTFEHNARIVVKGADNKETYSLEVDEDDTLAFVFRDVNGTFYGIDGTRELPQGEWVNIAGTYNGNSMNSYVNGLIERSNTIGPVLLSEDPNDLAIANRSDANDRQFEGAVDDVRIYNYGLSQNEILWVVTQCGGYHPCRLRPNLYCNRIPLPEIINFKDYAILAEHWLEVKLWPPEP